MRKFNDESRSLALLRMYTDISLMQMNNLLRQCHADTMSFRHLLLFPSIEQGKQMLLVGFRHSDARIRQTYDGPLVPVRDLDKRRLVGRILTVIFNQIRESNIQQIQIPFHRNQTVILCLLLFEQQIDVIIWMSTQINSRASSNNSSSRISCILICSF